MNPISNLRVSDPDLYRAMMAELGRQRGNIELIASENFTSTHVMEALGTWLTNKYAEGLPGKRYYGGCDYVDEVEVLAIERVKSLFGAEAANVQPHSGADANSAVFLAFLNPGDKVLGMDLSHGGHLTHGSPVNFSGKFFKFASYGVDQKTGRINYDALEKQAKDYQPKLVIGGASAYARVIDFERMAHIAKAVGAIFMVDMAHIAGLVAAGLHPSPIPHADVVTSTTHKTLRGPRAGIILCKAQHAPAINKAVFPGLQGGPHMHVIAAKAVAFKEAATPEFKTYQQQIVRNAYHLADCLQKEGFTLVSGGTDNHLMLVDLRSKGVTGKAAEMALDEIGVTVNKNTVPFETESPFVTSGIRIGTPAATTRGMKEEAMGEIAAIIAERIHTLSDAANVDRLRQRVHSLCDQYPLYPELG